MSRRTAACDFIESVTLTGRRHYILAISEHATRRIRVLGNTAHPNAIWGAQAGRRSAPARKPRSATRVP
ncbi:hypothetical protein CG723_31430 [Streptomyces sp. CB01635]|nr:hypothetical protein CG723_31430 [Streptomyces sp. CB01635]